MITGFEDITYELKPDELLLANRVAHWLRDNACGRRNMKKSAEIERAFNVQGARLRKIVNYIRATNTMRFLLSNSKGYWYSNDVVDVEDCIKSMRERADAISHVAKQMSEGLAQYTFEKENGRLQHAEAKQGALF